MPGKIRSLDRGRIQLSESLQAQVEYLARLAGVRPADIVNFVLSEVLEGDGEAEPAPTPARPAPQAFRPKRPADVIPISRKQPPMVPCTCALDHLDPAYLRRQAADVRRLAQIVRARAAEACRAAHGARVRALALQGAGA